MLKKLQEYCDCVEGIDQRDIDELINLISQMTCWQTKPEDTFFNSERQEILDLKGNEKMIKFIPFFQPYDIESFHFTLATIDGMDEEKTELVKDVDFKYSEVESLFKIKFDFKPECNACSNCPTYKLIIDYTAGYEEIPDFLLPVLCNLLNIIKAKNTCDCESCTDCNNKTENPNERVNYSKGDILTVALENELGELLQKNYMTQLSRISLCEKCCEIWGEVV